MSTIDGYYYLHANGSLIWRRYLDGGQVADFRESDLVRHFWPLVLNDRETAWSLLVEALALGAEQNRVDELAKLWLCNDADAQRYAEHVGFELEMDGNAWCARRAGSINLQECPHGFGATCLEAMADLCRQLGFRAQKTWGPTFKSLVQCPCDGKKTVDARCAGLGECVA